MRNLKKFLALVMAMVMAFSLMISASAAEVKPSTGFSDNDGITEAFVEAVDVLGGMKVYKGDDTGTLRPGSTITRAEVAALIYRLATGDVDDVRAGLYANYGNFADVNESDWFAGYVGYCANAGYIKGHGGYFNPYDSVTGYETLAMILRAIGYDKNHEFEGATWQTNVSALGTQLGCLDDVKTTDYANTLHLASRRDVVASILFRAAAYVHTVNYTPMAGYNQFDNVIGNVKNPTLGEKLFGLTYGQGIVVSNQGTGDTKTVWRVDEMKQGSKAVYYTDNGLSGSANKETHTDISLKWETGLKDFGHKFKVWYNRDDSGAKTVYTAYDKVVKTQLVAVNDTTDGAADANGDGDNDWGSLNAGSALATEVTKVGFVNNGKAFMSDSFKKFNYVAYDTVDTKSGNTFSKANPSGTDTADADGHRLYLLISNTSGNVLDAVVAMNVESSTITQIDNMSSTKTIKLPSSADNSAAPASNEDRFAPTDDLVGEAIAIADGTKIEIKQSKLTANSTKTLGDYAVNVAIGVNRSTTASRNITNYNVSKIVDTKVGQVVSYNTSEYNDTRLATINTKPDTVTLADGTKLEKSLLYYTVQDDTIPQVDYQKPDGWADDAQSQDQYANITYKFYLDSEGKYIGAEPVREAEFIYGTYADYSQATSTSTFKYFMTGVNDKGEVVTKEFDAHNGSGMTRQSISGLKTYYHNFGVDNTETVSGLGRVRSYYGTTKTEVGATVKYNRYNGFMLSNGGLFEDAATAAACGQMSPERFGYKKLIDDDTPHYATVNASGVRTGAVEAATDNGTDLFLTENTKFIVVSGAGTDTIKSTVYNGITEFLGDSTDVSFYVGCDDDADFDHIDTFYTIDDDWYANAESRYSHGIETIFLNAANVKRSGTNGLLFLGSATPILTDAYNANYKLFTFYNGDQAQNMWIDITNAPTHTTFYNNLQAVGKTSTGETVYDVGAAYAKDDNADGTFDSMAHGRTDDLPILSYFDDYSDPVAGRDYVPTTLDARTAMIGGYLYNVANAKVVNLSTRALPNMGNTVADLNAAASYLLGDTGTDRYVYVTFVTTSPTSNVVSTIYVTDVTAP